jgi:hypothetical protein
MSIDSSSGSRSRVTVGHLIGWSGTTFVTMAHVLFAARSGR